MLDDDAPHERVIEQAHAMAEHVPRRAPQRAMEGALAAQPAPDLGETVMTGIVVNATRPALRVPRVTAIGAGRDAASRRSWATR